MNHPKLNRRSLMRSPRYRDELFRQGGDVQEIISREIMAATEKLAERMEFADAYELACKTANEAAAGWRAFEKIKPVREALEKLVGPDPLTVCTCFATPDGLVPDPERPCMFHKPMPEAAKLPAPYIASTLRLIADHFDAPDGKKIIINPSSQMREEWGILLNAVADELDGVK
jgi:hypothetical protein